MWGLGELRYEELGFGASSSCGDAPIPTHPNPRYPHLVPTLNAKQAALALLSKALAHTDARCMYLAAVDIFDRTQARLLFCPWFFGRLLLPDPPLLAHCGWCQQLLFGTSYGNAVAACALNTAWAEHGLLHGCPLLSLHCRVCDIATAVK